MAPFADAVCFVDGDARERRLGEPRAAGGAEEPFGREVDEAVPALERVLFAVVGVLQVEGGVDEGGGDAVGAQGLDLVLHECDERRDDEREAGVLRDGGELVAERLTPAGGQDDEHVPAGEGVFDDLLLHGSERVVPEVPLEQRGQRGVVCECVGRGGHGCRVSGRVAVEGFVAACQSGQQGVFPTHS